MDAEFYTNMTNQANTNPFLNKPIDNTPTNCLLIYLNGSPDVTNLLHDRIKMIAKDGFIMGTRGSNIAVIETDLPPAVLRDKLAADDGSRAEIFVMRFNFIDYAGWLNQSNSTNVKAFFKDK
jgi:hypothetical protein